MNYFTKEWYISTHPSLDVPKPIEKKAGRRKRHTKDKTMHEYHKYLSKIEDTLPSCLRSTLHGNIVKSADFENDAFVICFDNSGGFSDVEKMYLYDAQIVEKECELEGKTWIHEEFSVIGAGYRLSALLIDENKELYYFTVQFSSVECVCTVFTNSTEAGISETLESVFFLSMEESIFDFKKPNWVNFLRTLKTLASYKISDENLYRYEAGIYNHACEEFFEISVTRQVFCRNETYQLYINLLFPPDGDAQEISDTVCSDVFDSFDDFINAIKASDSFNFINNNNIPLIKYDVRTEQI